MRRQVSTYPSGTSARQDDNGCAADQCHTACLVYLVQTVKEPPDDSLRGPQSPDQSFLPVVEVEHTGRIEALTKLPGAVRPHMIRLPSAA